MEANTCGFGEGAACVPKSEVVGHATVLCGACSNLLARARLSATLNRAIWTTSHGFSRQKKFFLNGCWMVEDGGKNWPGNEMEDGRRNFAAGIAVNTRVVHLEGSRDVFGKTKRRPGHV